MVTVLLSLGSGDTITDPWNSGDGLHPICTGAGGCYLADIFHWSGSITDISKSNILPLTLSIPMTYGGKHIHGPPKLVLVKNL